MTASTIPPQEPITFRHVTPTELGREHWAATERGELHLRRCRECGHVRLYLTALCPDCHAEGHDVVVSSGLGTVFASTVVRYRLSPEFPAAYVLALVDLDEGVRMMANVLGADDPAVVPIGTRVQLGFEMLPSGQRLPQFVVVRTTIPLD